MKSSRLMTMPTEVLEKIAGQCDARGLGALRQTCRALRGVQDSLARQLFRQVYAGIVRQLVEDLTNRRNALFVELHKLPPADHVWVTTDEYNSILARMDSMVPTRTGALSVYDHEELDFRDVWIDDRKPDQFFVQVFVPLNPPQRLSRNSRPDQVLDEITVCFGSKKGLQERSVSYDLSGFQINNSGAFIDSSGGDWAGEWAPFVQASKRSFETHAPPPGASFESAIIEDAITMFHNDMLHYLGPRP